MSDWNPQSHGCLGKGGTGGETQGKVDLSEVMDSWRGWPTPRGSVALEGSQ